MRRPPKLELVPLLGALADPSQDDTTNRILTAAAEVLVLNGLRRCTVEEIADRAQIGRTTIYRRFEGRDEIVHAVLARELRTFFSLLTDAVSDLDRVEDRVVEAFLTGLAIADESPMVALLRSEPDLMMFLLSDAGPVLEMVTQLLVAQLRTTIEGEGGTPGTVDAERARHGAEVLFRLAVSFALMPQSTLPLDDPPAARVALHSLFDPIVHDVVR